MPKSWTVKHFSLANRSGPKQQDVPTLLRRLADHIEKRGAVEVQDITFSNDVNEHGVWPSMTVYFHSAQKRSS